MRGAWLTVLGLALLACDEPGASLEITGARAFRAPDGRVVVDVDLLAFEGLGGSVGTYCARATFAGQERPAEQCAADLEDGDVKTVRFVSDAWMPEGAAIAVRVRLDRSDVGRALVAPR